MKKYEKPWFIALAVDQNDVVTASPMGYDNDGNDKGWENIFPGLGDK